MNHDLFSDTIIRIKQGHLKCHSEILCPRTKMVCSVLNVLWKEGLIDGYQYLSNNDQLITVKLAYRENNHPKLYFLKRHSRPGKRVYTSVRQLRSLLNRGISNYGFYILSTNRGIISSTEALQLNVGGEILCFAG